MLLFLIIYSKYEYSIVQKKAICKKCKMQKCNMQKMHNANSTQQEKNNNRFGDEFLELII